MGDDFPASFFSPTCPFYVSDRVFKQQQIVVKTKLAAMVIVSTDQIVLAKAVPSVQTVLVVKAAASRLVYALMV